MTTNGIDIQVTNLLKGVEGTTATIAVNNGDGVKYYAGHGEYYFPAILNALREAGHDITNAAFTAMTRMRKNNETDGHPESHSSVVVRGIYNNYHYVGHGEHRNPVDASISALLDIINQSLRPQPNSPGITVEDGTLDKSLLETGHTLL